MKAIEPPPHWREEPMEVKAPNGQKWCRHWRHKIVEMGVIRSISEDKDAGTFIHVSVSRPDRLPSWAELTKVAEEFIGDVPVMQMIPRKKDYVNVHSHCLHLWAPIEPNFKVPNLMKLIDEKPF